MLFRRPEGEMVGDAASLAADDFCITVRELGSRISGRIRTARAVYTLHINLARKSRLVGCYVVVSVMQKSGTM